LSVRYDDERTGDYYRSRLLKRTPSSRKEVAHVTHRDTVENVVRLVLEVERHVLARADRWHLKDRVLMDGNRTVVFE
jgi:formyltetrahydrofolate deformylase